MRIQWKYGTVRGLYEISSALQIVQKRIVYWADVYRGDNQFEDVWLNFKGRMPQVEDIRVCLQPSKRNAMKACAIIKFPAATGILT